MAFDTPTRNRLSQFVGDARELLSDEFTDQFQVAYGMDPDTGEVADLERLSHLDDAQRQTAIILRETLAHYYANLPTQQKDQAKDYQPLIQRIVREQAFTILNRLCAIRMAEARDLVIESIGAGVQSKGFQLYQHVCGNSLGETGAAYQQYLLSLFDEFGVDLPVLFDRYSPQGRLFPRETVLTELIGMINDPEINRLWAEDETIGWIYQYFNSKEERKAMRDASQAPRNSRELAVRNQFFTPRYVVEFLTDNTLGRIWYEIRKGETGLKESCQYLVRRPNEIFLAEGEEGPETDSADQEKDLTQEELLNQPVHIPHRLLKDPREIRMLDPACGSMHFGLYAFDLYLKIYEEFWDLVTAEPSVAIEPTELSPLAECYESRDAFLRDVPRLIIEHNIHGIDIDSRAVQIAGLSLWLRAQRSWKSQGIAAGDRPQVTRSNVVCAEPMPGDQQQLEAFCKELHPAIAQMVTAIFEEMKLAGEAGSLLKIEQEISSLVAAAKKQFQDNPPDKKIQQQFFGGASVVKEHQMEFDLSGITDEFFFEKAEEEIYSALKRYASESSEGGFRRKLFAGDAEKGFAFIELCRKRFDVALMNPPFGQGTDAVYDYISTVYEGAHNDLFASFVRRGRQVVQGNGALGAITSRAFLVAKRSADFRETDFLPRAEFLLDLGLGVMDDAWVESCAYILSNVKKSQSFAVADMQRLEEKSEGTLDAIKGCEYLVADRNSFSGIPTSPVLYKVSQESLRTFSSLQRFEPDFGTAREGMRTFDDFRFVRVDWELAPGESLSKRSSWCRYAKGGEFSVFDSHLPLVVARQKDGLALDAVNLETNGSTAQVRQASTYWFRSGATYSRRSARGFSARVLPSGYVISDRGPAILAMEGVSTPYLLGWLNSRLVRSLIHLQASASLFTSGIIKRLPWAVPTDVIVSDVEANVDEILRLCLLQSKRDETRINYCPSLGEDLVKAFDTLTGTVEHAKSRISELMVENDKLIDAAYGMDSGEIGELALTKEQTSNVIQPIEPLSKSAFATSTISQLIGAVFGRWNLTQNGSVETNWFRERTSAGKSSNTGVGEQVLPEEALISAALRHGDNAVEDWESAEAFIADALGTDVSKWVSEKFFAFHLGSYSFKPRSAPIYWPISTESGSYTLWFYYHRLTDQTLYLAVNDFVDPKLKQTTRQLADLRAIQDRSSTQEKELAQLTELESELEQFKADLLEIAAFWKPNLNDGVQITAAPLWKFFRLKKWRDKLKKTWSELESGKYDWAHLALSIWPERVVKEKCTTDRSIAIAHDLEEQLWHEVEVTKVSKSGRERTKIEWQPRDLSESEFDASVDAVKSGKHVRASDSTEQAEWAAAAGH